MINMPVWLTHLLIFIIGTGFGVFFFSLLCASHREDDLELQAKALKEYRDSKVKDRNEF